MSSGYGIQSSIKAHLLARSRERKEDYNLILLRYVSERFLYRLGLSPYKDSFILKGAYLLTITLDRIRYRTTKDIDFLKIGDADSDSLKSALQDISAIPDPSDGIRFDPESISLTAIREAHQYQGQRAKITAYIGNTRIVLQLDIGVGDAVHPAIVRLSIPSLLGQTPPAIAAYPLETVIAEKLEAIVSIGLITSRMKDFYDLYIITTTTDLNIDTVREAVHATFRRRKTDIPKILPDVLSDIMVRDPVKQTQWTAFLRRIQAEESSPSLAEALIPIRKLAAAVFFVE